MPSADITTDLLVGFPTETIEDFEQTVSLIDQVRFTAAFMFAYSPRPGTRAEELGDTVPTPEKQRRLRAVIDLQTEITKEHHAAMVGRQVSLLVTGRQRGRDRLWLAQDCGCKNAVLSCRDNIAGMILDARVAGSSGMTLICERSD
jgi:tRNA-2-methylthio-N6-dimethylallyladenosine synthase